MKKLFKLLMAAVLLVSIQFQISCSEPDSEPNILAEPTMGDATFWLASDLGLGNITVTCNGVSQIITGYYASTPSCGASLSANFNLSPGTYTYNATAGNTVWNGSITILAGECTTQQFIASGGNGSGNNQLNGKWISSAGNGITISGSQGLLYALSPNWQTAANSGYVNIGTLKLKDITTLNASQWSCKDLFLTTTNGTIDGVQWSNDGTITMNANGTSITVTSTGPFSGITGNVVYNKVQ